MKSTSARSAGTHSVAAVAYYTAPQFITLPAGLLVGDRIGVAGWVAVFAGFCGVLLIPRPHAEVFGAYSLLPVLSAVLYALAMILARTKCRSENPLVLSLALNLSFIGLGGLAALLIALSDLAPDPAGGPFLWGRCPRWMRLPGSPWPCSRRRP